MKMDRAKKQAFVEDLAGKLAAAECVYLTDFSGLDVERITQLRSKLRDSSVEYVVVKNTLARRAIAGTAAEPLDRLLEGPTAFAVSRADAVAAAKALTDFAKDTDLPRIKGGIVAGRILSLDEIRRLASLPGREVLLSRLMGSMTSPVSGFVFVLVGVLSKLVRTLDALRAQRAEAGSGGEVTSEGSVAGEAASSDARSGAEASPDPGGEASMVSGGTAEPGPAGSTREEKPIQAEAEPNAH